MSSVLGRGVVVLSAVLMTGCPSSGNKCVPGKVESCPCGFGSGTQLCNSDGTFDVCQCASGTGGGSATGGGAGVGGGAGAGGGGAAGGGIGGGIGMTQQEVLSGTRLKALHLTGDDGSDLASVNGFYDTQLQELCLPSTASYSFSSALPVRCYPLYFLGEATGCFTDSACQTPCGFAISSVIGGTNDVVLNQQVLALYVNSLDGGQLFKYAMMADGGWGQVGATSNYTGDAYRSIGDGGCVFDGAGTTYVQAASVTPIPATTFVGFTSRHD